MFSLFFLVVFARFQIIMCKLQSIWRTVLRLSFLYLDPIAMTLEVTVWSIEIVPINIQPPKGGVPPLEFINIQLECPKNLKMFKLDLTWSSRSSWTWFWPDLNLLKQNLTWPELEVSSQVFFGFPEKNLIFFWFFLQIFSQEYATSMNF